MSESWLYQYDWGAMANEDYPYTGKEGKCKHDKSKAVAEVDDWDFVEGVDNIIKRLHKQALTIGVAANDDAWFFYESGIVTSSECGKAKDLDHAVALVGYSPGDGSGESETKIIVETECRRRRWWDRWYDSGCRWWDEFLSDDGKFCCWEEEYEVEE